VTHMRSNHALQRLTVASRCCSNRRDSWPPSLGLRRQRRRRGILVESRPQWKPKLRRSSIALMMPHQTGLGHISF